MDSSAAESTRPSITVIAVGAVKHTLPEIARAFSEQFDCNVELSFNTAGVTRSKVEAGCGADIVVTVARDLPAMRQKALIEAVPSVELGVMRMGMAIRTDDEAPDISTPAAFKQALEQARSISYANPASGASAGVHFDALLRRLSVDHSVRKKSILTQGGLAAIQAVADRKSDLGFALVSEIRGTKGVILASLLPEELQLVSIYSGAILAGKNSGKVAEFMTFLTGEFAKSRLAASGFQPS
jgi:molybdate transport system substrate-binding protein